MKYIIHDYICQICGKSRRNIIQHLNIDHGISINLYLYQFYNFPYNFRIKIDKKLLNALLTINQQIHTINFMQQIENINNNLSNKNINLLNNINISNIDMLQFLENLAINARYNVEHIFLIFKEYTKLIFEYFNLHLLNLEHYKCIIEQQYTDINVCLRQRNKQKTRLKEKMHKYTLENLIECNICKYKCHSTALLNHVHNVHHISKVDYLNEWYNIPMNVNVNLMSTNLIFLMQQELFAHPRFNNFITLYQYLYNQAGSYKKLNQQLGYDAKRICKALRIHGK